MTDNKQLSRREFIKKSALVGGMVMTAGFLDGVFTANRAMAEDRLSEQPLWVVGSKRNKIVVVSDLHFGVDDAFAENVGNRPYFIQFLKRLQHTPDVRELVIAGDFLDEWFLPLDYKPVEDMTAFFQAVMDNNKEVITELKNVMAVGIKLVYVIGNHDMNLEKQILAKALPGIIQPLDAKGLGRYITGDRREIIIEHCHRFDPYSAPDRITNKDLFNSDATMYPPGYFYARMGTSWVMEKKPHIEKDFPALRHRPAQADTDQMGAYVYGKILEQLFKRISVREGFEEKVFNIKSCGLNDSYSLKDMYPVEQADGTISAPVLFKNFQRTWDKRQEMNDVVIKIPFLEAGASAGKPAYFYDCAKKQYLENSHKSYDIVIFGHTHVPDFQHTGKQYYINTGTWVDHNSDYPAATRTFSVIETSASSKANLFVYGEDGSIKNVL
jgi:UDP-2,3-diacylglucosamine pyrophosphatase LpxH